LRASNQQADAVCHIVGMDAELAAAVECAKDLMYLFHMLTGMGLHVKLPMPLFVNNETAINTIRNYISGGQTHHTAVRMHYLRELQERGHVELECVAGVDYRVDIGTKNLDQSDVRKAQYQSPW
jgi:hypothetical protein